MIPLRNKMRHPQLMGNLITCAMTFLALLYWSFGGLSQMAFGEVLKDKGSITIALPKNNRQVSIILI